MNYFLFHLSVSSFSFLFPAGEKYRKLHVSLLCNSYDVLYVIDDSRIVSGRLKSQEPLRCVLNWKPVECTDDSRFFFPVFLPRRLRCVFNYIFKCGFKSVVFPHVSNNLLMRLVD